MTNAQVFSAFANGNEAKSGSVRSERQGDVLVLVSYNTPIAFRKRGPYCTCSDGQICSDCFEFVFTSRKFSQTTSKQQTQAKYAIRQDESITLMDWTEFRAEGALHGVNFSGAR